MFNIHIVGHAAGPHNAEVKAIFEKAMNDLRGLPGLEHLAGSGSTSDQPGVLDLLFGGIDPTPTPQFGEAKTMRGPGPSEVPTKLGKA